MPVVEDFDQVLTKSERQVLAQLTTPSKIQAFLDGFPYLAEPVYRCSLRVFREPIYRTLRELMMSYFEQFYNLEREKTLRGYTVPLNLKAFDRFKWMTSDEPLERIGKQLDKIRKVRLLTRRMIAGLSLIDERSYQAGLLGASKTGLHRPPQKNYKKV